MKSEEGLQIQDITTMDSASFNHRFNELLIKIKQEPSYLNQLKETPNEG